MLRKRIAQRHWGALVERNANLSWTPAAPLYMLKHSAHLFEGDAWEPVDKLRRHGAAFEVFEQCCNGYSGASKHPCSAHAIRVPLDCGAG